MLDESETSLNSSTGDADSVISKRLVTFRDVRELQQRNAELLAVVREMSANQVNSILMKVSIAIREGCVDEKFTPANIKKSVVKAKLG